MYWPTACGIWNSLPCLACEIPERRESLNGAIYLPNAPTPSLTDLIGGIGKFQPDGGTLQELHLILPETVTCGCNAFRTTAVAS